MAQVATRGYRLYYLVTYGVRYAREEKSESGMHQQALEQLTAVERSPDILSGA